MIGNDPIFGFGLFFHGLPVKKDPSQPASPGRWSTRECERFNLWKSESFFEENSQRWNHKRDEQKFLWIKITNSTFGRDRWKYRQGYGGAELKKQIHFGGIRLEKSMNWKSLLMFRGKDLWRESIATWIYCRWKCWSTKVSRNESRCLCRGECSIVIRPKGVKVIHTLQKKKALQMLRIIESSRCWFQNIFHIFSWKFWEDSPILACAYLFLNGVTIIHHSPIQTWKMTMQIGRNLHLRQTERGKFDPSTNDQSQVTSNK